VAKSRFEIAAPVIERELAKPYRYGEADCFFLGCRVADAFDKKRRMGPDHYRAYSSLFGAQKALRKRGYISLSDLFAARLEPIAPAQCQFGDIGIILLSDGEHVGVCVGQGFVTKTEKGRSFHGLDEAIAAFRT
jgi:hypothetical protein